MPSVTWEARSGRRRRMANIVQFENVGLRYGTGAETLSDVSFTLKRGRLLFPDRPVRRGQDLAAQAALSRAAPDARGDPAVRRGCGDACRAQRLPGFRRRIGVVFQDFRLVPHLSAFDNVALPLRVAGSARERGRGAGARDARLGRAHRSRRRASPPTLSGGEQQRVAIARAVIGRPEMLVADEPTGNVDPEMAERLLHLFDALNRLGTTVVVATHDIHLLNRIPNAQMMRLEHGRLTDPTGALRYPPALEPDDDRSASIPTRPTARLLDEGRRTRAMPWVIAIMMFLTVLAGALGLGMFAATSQLDRELAGRLTVQIVEPMPSRATRQAAAMVARARPAARRGARTRSRSRAAGRTARSRGSAMPGSIPICRCRR